MEQILAFLRDAQWQFWGVVVGLLGIGAALLIWWLERQHKELSYAVQSEASIVNVSWDSGRDIEVLYRGQPVKNLTSVVVAVKNTGKAPILRSDFDEPITITFSDTARLLDARSTGDTDQIPAQIGYTPQSATLQPLLLNSGDEVTVSCLVEGHVAGKLKLRGRIVGVPKIKMQADSRWPGNLLLVGFVLIPSVFVLVLNLLGLLASEQPIELLSNILNAVAVGIALTGVVYALLQRR